MKTVLAVIIGLVWSLVPKRLRPNRPWQRKGIRTIVHTPYGGAGNPNRPFVYAIYFGQGAGYIGGATLYLAFGGCRIRDKRGCWSPTSAFVFGLTSNANNVPLAGIYAS